MTDAELAKSVPIEEEVARRGIRLKRSGAERVGPCPVCGGRDPFSINTRKQVFNCRGCHASGDGIDLVQHLDGSDFAGAITQSKPTLGPAGDGLDDRRRWMEPAGRKNALARPPEPFLAFRKGQQ